MDIKNTNISNIKELYYLAYMSAFNFVIIKNFLQFICNWENSSYMYKKNQPLYISFSVDRSVLRTICTAGVKHNLIGIAALILKANLGSSLFFFCKQNKKETHQLKAILCQERPESQVDLITNNIRKKILVTCCIFHMKISAR